MCRMVDRHQPKHLFNENVLGWDDVLKFVGHTDKGKPVSSITHFPTGAHATFVDDLDGAGYDTEWSVTTPKLFGIPMTRNRFMWQSGSRTAYTKIGIVPTGRTPSNFISEKLKEVIKLVISFHNVIPTMPLDAFLLPDGHPVLQDISSGLRVFDEADEQAAKKRKGVEPGWVCVAKAKYKANGLLYPSPGDDFAKFPQLQTNPWY